MVKILVDKNTFVNEGKPKYSLEYYLIESELLIEDCNYDSVTYGIEIVKKPVNIKDVFCSESSTVLDISTNKKSVWNFILKLKDNYITPILLKDLAYDFIEQNEAGIIF